MKASQFIAEISPISANEELDDVGMFLDLDFFGKHPENAKAASLAATVKKLHQKCWEQLSRVEKFLELV